MINYDLTLTEAIAVYKMTRNAGLAQRIVDIFTNADAYTLMKIEQALETQNEDFDFGEFLTELENKEKKEEWRLEFDPDAHILVEVETPTDTVINAWNEMRSPKQNEYAVVRINANKCVDGKITKAWCTTEQEWKKYYITEPLENDTIDKAHDPDRKLFARVAFEEEGKVYDYLWNSDVAYDDRPTKGDMVMVEIKGRCVCATLVSFEFKRPDPNIKYKFAYTEEDYPC